jgi:acyl-CoA thioester hydrolase
MNGFEYPVHVYPHHTDCAGVVWHGTYLAWMEEARVAYLSQCGVEYTTLIAQDCELPVVELSIRYHQFAKLGMDLLWQMRLCPLQGVRWVWDYELRSLDLHTLYLTAQVILVPIRTTTGKIRRKIPLGLQRLHRASLGESGGQGPLFIPEASCTVQLSGG